MYKLNLKSTFTADNIMQTQDNDFIPIGNNRLLFKYDRFVIMDLNTMQVERVSPLLQILNEEFANSCSINNQTVIEVHSIQNGVAAQQADIKVYDLNGNRLLYIPNIASREVNNNINPNCRISVQDDVCQTHSIMITENNVQYEIATHDHNRKVQVLYDKLLMKGYFPNQWNVYELQRIV